MRQKVDLDDCKRNVEQILHFQTIKTVSVESKSRSDRSISTNVTGKYIDGTGSHI